MLCDLRNPGLPKACLWLAGWPLACASTYVNSPQMPSLMLIIILILISFQLLAISYSLLVVIIIIIILILIIIMIIVKIILFTISSYWRFAISHQFLVVMIIILIIILTINIISIIRISIRQIHQTFILQRFFRFFRSLQDSWACSPRDQEWKTLSAT